MISGNPNPTTSAFKILRPSGQILLEISANLDSDQAEKLSIEFNAVKGDTDS